MHDHSNVQIITLLPPRRLKTVVIQRKNRILLEADMQIQNLRRKRRVKAVVKNVVASFRGQFVCFSATIRSRSRTTSCVLEEDHSPLIREAAARLLPVGLQGGRYYPCGFFAMSFFSRKLIDGAENCGGERLTYRLGDSVILLTWMEYRLQTARSLFFPRFFLSFFF